MSREDMMRNRWKNLSETYRVFVLMVLLIVVLQLVTLLYLWRVESQILIEKERKSLTSHLSIHSKLLEEHLSGLEKRLEFLSRLEVMDDILVKDIDKRVTILFEQEAEELLEEILLLAKNSQNEVVATSKKSTSWSRTLHLTKEVKASFDKRRTIGTVTLLYPFTNLEHLKIDNPHQKLWLSPPFSDVAFKPKEIKESIVVTRELQGILKGWKISLSYEKSYALKTLREIETILIFGFLLSLLILLYILFKLSKRQIVIQQNTQELLELKKSFLSTMSHELRTPLGSVLNLTQHLMVNPKMAEEELEVLSKIENASENLLEMINNLLQLSKLESKSMPIVKKRVNIVALLHEIIELVEPLIDEESIELKVELAETTMPIYSDEQILKQIFMNLISNAIKYTHKGSICITLVKQKEAYLFRVIDTGIGIAKERQAELFSEFYQAHSGKKEIRHSCGLGLALSQKMAKLLNAKIVIESQGMGRGTVAEFRFSSFET